MYSSYEPIALYMYSNIDTTMSMTDAQKKAQEKYDEKYPKLFVRIDSELYNRLQGYSKVSGRPIKEIVSDSLKNYLDSMEGLVRELTVSKESTNLSRLKQFFGTNQEFEFNSFMSELDNMAESINNIRLLFKRK